MSSRPDVSLLLPDEVAVRAGRAALIAEVEPTHRRRRRPVRGRRLMIAVGALLVLGAGGAIAGMLLSADDVNVAAGVGCYDRASLDADVTLTPVAADPVAACADLWREGAVSGAGTAEPPPLVACTAKGEPVRVFPGADVSRCHDLGLEPLPSDYRTAASASARAHEALRVLASVNAAASICPAPDAQAAMARERLADANRAVAVTVRGEGPCAGGFDVSGDHVFVKTVSTNQAHTNWLDARVRTALEPLFTDPGGGCRSPQQVADHARGLLDAADLSQVAVRVSGDGECLNRSLEVDGSGEVVTLQTQ